MGFIVEAFGPREYVVRAIPASLASTGGTYLVNLLEELVTLIEEGGPTLREQAAAMIACKGAIKAKQHLSMERMQHLLRRLAQTSNPYACPHGRPIILQLDRREIERRFGRS